MAESRFGPKVVVVLGQGLAAWQELNVVAFLMSGIATSAPGLTGEPYRDGSGTQYAFAVPATEAVIRMQCSAGLCPTPEVARELAKRAYQKAHDASNFVDPAAERPQPYVPRGNVKGRAERIWLPLSRFWLPIR